MSFQITQSLDENGGVVLNSTGTWDSAEWERQIARIWQLLPSDFDPKGRPILNDMTECRFPEADWMEHFRFVAQKLTTRRKKPFRRAILINPGTTDDVGMAVRLLDAAQKAWHHPQIETRAFTDRDEAYAWVTEEWLRK